MINDFKFLIRYAGFKSDEELAKFFHVTVKTVRNWKQKEPPRSVYMCLSLMNGQLDCLGKAWKGFRLTPEVIESPEGDFIYAYEVRAIRYVYQAAGLQRAKICNMLQHQTPIKPIKKVPAENVIRFDKFRQL